MLLAGVPRFSSRRVNSCNAFRGSALDLGVGDCVTQGINILGQCAASGARAALHGRAYSVKQTSRTQKTRYAVIRIVRADACSSAIVTAAAINSATALNCKRTNPPQATPRTGANIFSRCNTCVSFQCPWNETLHIRAHALHAARHLQT